MKRLALLFLALVALIGAQPFSGNATRFRGKVIGTCTVNGQYYALNTATGTWDCTAGASGTINPATTNQVSYYSTGSPPVLGGFSGSLIIQPLSPPSAPTVVAVGSNSANTVWSYCIVALTNQANFNGGAPGGDYGATQCSIVTSITSNSTLDGTHINRITWTAVTGAYGYRVYRTTAAGTPNTTGIVADVLLALTLDDNGISVGSLDDPKPLFNGSGLVAVNHHAIFGNGTPTWVAPREAVIQVIETFDGNVDDGDAIGVGSNEIINQTFNNQLAFVEGLFGRVDFNASASYPSGFAEGVKGFVRMNTSGTVDAQVSGVRAEYDHVSGTALDVALFRGEYNQLGVGTPVSFAGLLLPDLPPGALAINTGLGKVEHRDIVVASNSASLASESLTNGALTGGVSWTTTGDFALAADAATYTNSAGSGTLQQASGTLAIAGNGLRHYTFTYTISLTGAPACSITTAFSLVAANLPLVAGSNTISFVSAASPGNFIISCTSSAAATVTFDDLSLKEQEAGDVIVGDTLSTRNLRQEVGGSINKATCWKTSSTLGFCSSVVAVDGSCTCN